MDTPLHIIAHIESDFPTKFGIPRQSGMVDSLAARVVFTPPYRNPDAVRGLEAFSHIWLIWGFSAVPDQPWSPTVRPPRLGGNRRVGVFATRSPFRPNAIGLSSVALRRVEQHPSLGPVLHVAGADLMDKTPIYDIKPYLPYTDCHPDAVGGFAAEHEHKLLTVEIPPVLLSRIPPERREALSGVLAQDPRPAYQSDPDRIYGMPFGNWDVKFTVADGTLTVTDICAP
ncbi:MAG: tRNA (N6-threonylcarbamoyladenosine(37)-N6)-methyltransferase TrmO [Oscillospiraceae bacterium]|nr:tRNA (N6-threonylcarbamoyladenosine(37)-N6)-methyltransferase TrmO [Oscillospiraceae bacterium]